MLNNVPSALVKHVNKHIKQSFMLHRPENHPAKVLSATRKENSLKVFVATRDVVMPFMLK
jgi:hypothetical protein